MQDIYTTKEVAVMFRRSTHTVCRWVCLKRLRPIRGTGGGGQYLFTIDEIKSFKKQLQAADAY